MKPLTEEEKAYLHSIVYEVAPDIIKRHVESCPFGRKLTAIVYIAIGLGLGLGVLSGGTILAIVSSLHH